MGICLGPPPRGEGSLPRPSPSPLSNPLQPPGSFLLCWRKAGDPQESLERNQQCLSRLYLPETVLPKGGSCFFPTGSIQPSLGEVEGSQFSGALYSPSKAEIGGGDALPGSPCWRLTQTGPSVFLPLRKDPPDGGSPGPAYGNGGGMA